VECRVRCSVIAPSVKACHQDAPSETLPSPAPELLYHDRLDEGPEIQQHVANGALANGALAVLEGQALKGPQVGFMNGCFELSSGRAWENEQSSRTCLDVGWEKGMLSSSTRVSLSGSSKRQYHRWLLILVDLEAMSSKQQNTSVREGLG